jgi:hypothetical protein
VAGSFSGKTHQNSSFLNFLAQKMATTKGMHDSCSVAEHGLFWLHSAIVPLHTGWKNFNASRNPTISLTGGKGFMADRGFFGVSIVLRFRLARPAAWPKPPKAPIRPPFWNLLQVLSEGGQNIFIFSKRSRFH